MVVSSVLLLGLGTPPASGASEYHRGFRATMIRREKAAAINFTRAASQSYSRLSMLAARLDGATSTQSPLRADGAGAYDMEVSIGTPPQKLTALADTGSDLVWAKCGPCASCTPRGSPSFDPTASSSFSNLPCSDPLCQALRSSSSRTTCASLAECDYQYFYGLAADHYTQGRLGSETFVIGSEAVERVGFGCTNMSTGNYGTGSGLVGLGHGPLSLVSQLGVGAFSYCLIDDPTKASPLLFGAMATLLPGGGAGGGGVQSTRLLDTSTFYTVNLNAISVGTETTPGTDTTGGVIFDSGTTLTFLTEPAYTAAKTAILTQTSLPRVANRGRFEACFQASSDEEISSSVVPPMVLHFDGGADMKLPPENYFVGVGNDGVVCWVVQRSSSISIIGNVMQMNYHIRYDLQNKMLSFQKVNCDTV
ncbi:hypothetical protein QOZ80_1AG0009700 [Eleusine coracana subsp. coracana]|nr:hypothetical protein QOZ80_1AG0009700 [Eleusine coracana subsp. coracana]